MIHELLVQLNDDEPVVVRPTVYGIQAMEQSVGGKAKDADEWDVLMASAFYGLAPTSDVVDIEHIRSWAKDNRLQVLGMRQPPNPTWPDRSLERS